MKLTNVARASLEELRLDYEDFLRQRGLPLWSREDGRRQRLIDRRCRTADAGAAWVREEHESGRCGLGGRGGQETSYPELAANGALALLAVGCSLLDRQLSALACSFETEGGFTERLYRVRTQHRASSTGSPASTSSTEKDSP